MKANESTPRSVLLREQVLFKLHDLPPIEDTYTPGGLKIEEFLTYPRYKQGLLIARQYRDLQGKGEEVAKPFLELMDAGDYEGLAQTLVDHGRRKNTEYAKENYPEYFNSLPEYQVIDGIRQTRAEMEEALAQSVVTILESAGVLPRWR